MNYNKLLLDELRLVSYEKRDAALTDKLLTKAVTLNENLKALGYVLTPPDLAALAVSPSLDNFYANVAGMMDEVNAQPMYPGFPKQVMEMETAMFRFHQLVHYFSTYGMEQLFGVAIQKGWLPCERKNKSNLSEQILVLKAKTIRLIPDEECYIAPLRVIFFRRERMTLPEREIVAEAISHVSPEQLNGLKVGFKENMDAVYEIVFALEDREAAFRMLLGLCQHTGDVLRCVDLLLRRKKYHFHTSEKRFLVKLLESYPEKDFRANLVLSGKNAERNILLLNYLDYSIYSRSDGHMDAVNDLRDGRLRSWESVAKYMLINSSNTALDFIAQRPGMMLRMVAWLMRLGYEKDAIVGKLTEKVSALSMQTLVTNLNYFGKLTEEDRADSEALYSAFEDLLLSRMQTLETKIQGKKVMFRMGEYDLDASEIHCSDKSAEGGFIRSGIAYRIPKEIDRLRFFVYWNDDVRVDVDLHAGYADLEGKAHSVGWNWSFKDCGVVFSGDITHSDAAEYIDVDLTAPIDKVNMNIHLFSGRPDFSKVGTCYVGMMAVPKGKHNGKDTELYSEANCFFKHNLRQTCQTINYGYIDVQNRCLIFDGEPHDWGYDWYSGVAHRRGKLSLARYLELLMDAQGAVLCDNEEDADVILVMGKPEAEKEVSLIDENFFMD
ncbi:MAG: hypothetical protein IKP19_05690 [Oscillospiraceae bacterium]|nr:hypothetical protein [Oscillospiraceae bacterium]